MFGPRRKRRRALPPSAVRRDEEPGIPKLVAIFEAEGGLVVVKPDGSQAIVPQSDDRSRNAEALGELLLEILEDDAQPSAQTSSPGSKKSAGVGDLFGEYQPRAGESADDFQDRVATDLGIRAGQGIWRTLQRMSGTRK